MKRYKVFLFCSLTFLLFSLYEGKIDLTIADIQKDYPKKIKSNTVKNSTFTLEPYVLQIVNHCDKQVVKHTKFEVYVDAGLPLKSDTQTII